MRERKSKKNMRQDEGSPTQVGWVSWPSTAESSSLGQTCFNGNNN